MFFPIAFPWNKTIRWYSRENFYKCKNGLLFISNQFWPMGVYKMWPKQMLSILECPSDSPNLFMWWEPSFFLCFYNLWISKNSNIMIITKQLTRDGQGHGMESDKTLSSVYYLLAEWWQKRDLISLSFNLSMNLKYVFRESF